MSVRPRLLCLIQLPPPVHGMAVVNQQVANSKLLASRFDLEVIPLRISESIEDVAQVSVSKLVRALATGARLAHSLAVRCPDAVYFTPSPRGVGFYRDCLYVAIMKAFRVPRIYHLHGKGVTTQLEASWRRALYAWAFGGAWVIHLSPLLASDTAELVADDRLLFVPNGVPDSCGLAALDRIARSGPPRILYLSNMIEEKGPLVLLDALGVLKRRGVAFKATFAGAPGSDGCVEAFNSGVVRLGLSDHVRYVGPVYDQAKDALFRDHDIFVFPTYQEAFGLVLLEAMQWRLPVIATIEGAIPEIVEEGETGFLVPKRDHEALAHRLACLLGDPSRRAQMGERGRARYLERYTLVQFEQNLSAALARCVGSVAHGERPRLDAAQRLTSRS